MQTLKSVLPLCKNLRSSLGPTEPSSKISIQGQVLAPKFKVEYQIAENTQQYTLQYVSPQDFASGLFYKNVCFLPLTMPQVQKCPLLYIMC